MKINQIILVLPLLLVVFLSGCTDSSNSTEANTTSTIIITSTVTVPTEINLKVGETARTSLLEVTVASVQRASSYDYYSSFLGGNATQDANPGKVFFLVDAEIRYTGSDSAFVGSSKFSITDSEGFKYDPSLYLGQNTDGLEMFKQLYQNQRMKGKILFEVPASAQGLKIVYDLGNLVTGTKLVSWEISG
jgi:hypothetical protein